MTDHGWSAVLVYPVSVYAGLLVLADFGTGGVAFPLGFFVTLVFGVVTGLGLVRHPWWVAGGRVFLVVAPLFPIGYGWPPGSVPLDFASGVLLGAPFLWLEYAWRDSVGPGVRVVALEAALFFGLLNVATATLGPTGSSSSVGGQYVHSMVQVLAAQSRGIAAVLTGTVPTSMPLESSLDIVFVGLGVLAFAGVFLSWVAPHTALGEPLPWSWARHRPGAVPPTPSDGTFALRAGQRDALATRSLPTPPEAMLVPGLGAIAVTAVIVVLFLALAVGAPTFAVIALVFGSVAAAVALAAVLSRRLTPLGGLSV